MQVSVEVRDRRDDGRHRLTLDAVDAASPLVHDAHVGAGVHVRLDLLMPDRWTAVSAGDLDTGLLPGLIGAPAAQALRGRATGTVPLDVDPGAAGPWMRVAAVDAIDRWLHLPLDQALVDAERGIARIRAASTLAVDDPAVPLVVGDALRLARRGSTGLVDHLRHCRPMPSGLRAAMEDLVRGCAELARRVSGPDHDLDAVQEAWHAYLARESAGGGPSEPVPGRRPARRSRRCASVEPSLIDPRQVRARVLGLSHDPAAGEVCLSRDAAAGAVVVEVLAFGDPAQEPARRLLVRLIDRRSADELGHGLLVVTPARSRRGGPRYFRCSVPLPGSDVADLRADVYDSLSALPPAAGDTDPQLRDARRASVFLGEYRRLVALARTTPSSPDLSERVRHLARRSRPDVPAFGGGPTATDVLQLVGADDTGTAERLGAAGDSPWEAGPLGSTGGAGRLLVAELVSADDEVASR